MPTSMHRRLRTLCPKKARATVAPVGTSVLPPAQQVVILGAGPAGVGAAYQLVRKGIARVTMLEQRHGLEVTPQASSLTASTATTAAIDHPVAKAEIMDALHRMLGKDPLYQRRHGRILLRGRWIYFPLKPVDLFLRLPKAFAMSILADTARKVLPRDDPGPLTFAAVLERGLGRTICREFYFPYARKLWGVNPEELSVTTAQKRVSGSSLGKIFRKIAGQIPGLKAPGAGRFYTRDAAMARSRNVFMRRLEMRQRNSSSELGSPQSNERAAGSRQCVISSVARSA